MYFPPYESLLNADGLSKAAMQSDDRVTVSTKLLQFLIQTALLSSEFNDKSYLKTNSDVREAIQQGKLQNAKQHYVGYGYFEGRMGALPVVDENWYLLTYPDVDRAVKSGKIESATKHFYLIGAAEGRAPSEDLLDIANMWRKILNK